MKLHTTNYINTLIIPAEDCPVMFGEKPNVKNDKPTIASIQFDMLIKNPYKFSSDDVVFEVYAIKNDITKSEYEAARNQFFSKGQACLRCSPLTKRYGWAVHNNSDGKIALISSNENKYNELLNDRSLQIVKAMKSKR